MLNQRMSYNAEVDFLRRIDYEIREDYLALSLQETYYKVKPASIGGDKFEHFCLLRLHSIERNVSRAKPPAVKG